MRFLFISTLYPNSKQPTRATYSRSLLLALKELGHEVQVIAPVFSVPLYSRRRLPPAEEVLDGIRVLHPRIAYLPGLFTRFNHLHYRRALRRTLSSALAQFAPDHVSIGFAFPDGAALAPLCENASVSWSLQVLGSDFRTRVRQPALRQLVMTTLQRAPLIFCPGQALKRDMVATGITADKIVPFNNGVDQKIFHVAAVSKGSRAAAPRDKTVLFVGNLVPVKGLDRLLHAWAKLGFVRAKPANSATQTANHQPANDLDAFNDANRAPALTIIGDGPLRKKLERLARQLGINASVRFLGRKPHAQLPEYLRQAHCLCLPSRSEGMPNVVLEALACGTPVVATAVGEVPFIVKDGINGYVVAAPCDQVPPPTSSTAKQERHSQEPNKAALLDALAKALDKALYTTWDSQAVAATVKPLTWDAAAITVVDAITQDS
jgi:teichuronic acid biosynthesis glycosyltransferase TuaC